MLTALLNAPMIVQRAVAFSIFACGAALLLGLAWSVIDGLANRHETLLGVREQVGRLQRLAQTQLPAEATIEDKAGGLDLFASEPNLAIARANLQQRINDISASNNTPLASVSNLPDSEQDGVTLIGLRVDFSGGYDDVLRTVAAIEASIPLLIIRELNVHAAGVEQLDHPPELAAQLRVFGAIRVVAPADASSGEVLPQ
jgi:hypothetical protein